MTFRKITKKTKAIMLINVLGHCANMDQVMKIVKKYKLILIEDNCEGIGSTLNFNIWNISH